MKFSIPRLQAASAAMALLLCIASFAVASPAYGQNEPDFVLSLPAAADRPTVVPGDGVNIVLNLAASNGFNRRVMLRAEGFPAGATATFSPRSMVGSGPVTLRIATSSETPEGNF